MNAFEESHNLKLKISLNHPVTQGLEVCGQYLWSNPAVVFVTTCDVIVTWNPMLGLINDLRDDRATILAAALSRV